MVAEQNTGTPEVQVYTYKLLCKSGETKVLVYETTTIDLTLRRQELRQVINDFVTNN